MSEAARKLFISDFIDSAAKLLFIDSTGQKVDEDPSILVNNGAGIDFLVYADDQAGIGSLTMTSARSVAMSPPSTLPTNLIGAFSSAS